MRNFEKSVAAPLKSYLDHQGYHLADRTINCKDPPDMVVQLADGQKNWGRSYTCLPEGDSG